LLVALTALPLTALPIDLNTSASANAFITNIGLLAPGLFMLMPGSKLARRLLGVIWLPGAIGGEMTSLSSSNGSINFGIGSFASAIVAVTFLVILIRKSARTLVLRGGGLVEFAPVVLVLAICVWLQYASVYRDASLSHLTTLVKHGPYAGIYTTARKRSFLVTLTRDVSVASGPDCRVVFYDTFPAGYLLGHGRSETNSTWFLDVAGGRDSAYQRLLVKYFHDRGFPDVAVRLDRVPLAGDNAIVQTYPASDPLERLFRSSSYATVRSRPDYVIRRRRHSACAERGSP
jgi:hypothetical protein